MELKEHIDDRTYAKIVARDSEKHYSEAQK